MSCSSSASCTASPEAALAPRRLDLRHVRRRAHRDDGCARPAGRPGDVPVVAPGRHVPTTSPLAAAVHRPARLYVAGDDRGRGSASPPSLGAGLAGRSSSWSSSPTSATTSTRTGRACLRARVLVPRGRRRRHGARVSRRRRSALSSCRFPSTTSSGRTGAGSATSRWSTPRRTRSARPRRIPVLARYRPLDVSFLERLRERLERFRAVPPVRGSSPRSGLPRSARCAESLRTSRADHPADARRDRTQYRARGAIPSDRRAATAELHRLREEVIESAVQAAPARRENALRAELEALFAEARFPFRTDRSIDRLIVRAAPGEGGLDPTYRGEWDAATKPASSSAAPAHRRGAAERPGFLESGKTAEGPGRHERAPLPSSRSGPANRGPGLALGGSGRRPSVTVTLVLSHRGRAAARSCRQARARRSHRAILRWRKPSCRQPRRRLAAEDVRIAGDDDLGVALHDTGLLGAAALLHRFDEHTFLDREPVRLVRRPVIDLPVTPRYGCSTCPVLRICPTTS